MADKIILDYEADLKGIKAEFGDLKTQMKQAETAAKSSANETAKAYDKASVSVTKLEANVGRSSKTVTGSIDNTSRSVRNLDKAFNQAGGTAPKRLNEIDNSIKKTGGSLKNFGANVQGLSVGLGQIATSMGIAFGAQQIIAGLKESVAQFAEAELNAKKLAFAVKEIAGEGEAAFNRLMGQSGDLQSVSIFSDDDIQQAQTALLQYGLTTDQVEKLIPAIVDLASATGENLSSAQERVLSGINGQTKGLKDVGLQFKDTGDKTKNYEKILDGLNQKFEGATATALDTTSGKLANLKNQFGELQETVGGEIVPVLANIVEGFNGLSDGVDIDSLDKLGDAFDSLTTIVQVIPGPVSGVIQAFKEFRSAFDEILKGNYFGAFQDGVEGIANIITLGLYGTIKRFFIPAIEEVEDVLTDFERKQLDVANATDKQLNAKFKELSETTGITKESWDKWVTAVRESKIEQTFTELANVLDITEQKYQALVAISDKYGISARINSSLILDIKTATEDQLNVAFENFNQTLGVTRKDFDDYIGRVQKIPKLNLAAADSTKQMVGPYDSLTKSVGALMKVLQDQATLFEKGIVDFASVKDKAKEYADGQNELVRVNDAVTESLKRIPEAVLIATTSLSTVKVPLTPLQEALAEFKITYEELLKADKDYNDKSFQSAEELVSRRAALFSELGFQQQSTYEKNLEELENLKSAEILASDGTLASIQRIIDKYEEAKLVLQANNIAEISGALAGLAENLGNALTQIFGKAAGDSVAFATFQKAITLTTIALKSAEAIASGIAAVAAGASSGDPLKLIGGIASIVAGVGNIIGGIVNTVQETNVPAAPSFFEGTPYLERGSNPKGIDKININANEGEAIIPTSANASEPGLAQAWIDGNLDKWILNNKLPELSSMMDKSTPAAVNSYFEMDDERLYMNGKNQVALMQENNRLLKKSINKNRNPWAC